MKDDKKAAAAAEASIRRSISKLEACGVSAEFFLHSAARAEESVAKRFGEVHCFEDLAVAIRDQGSALYAPSVISKLVALRGSVDTDGANGEEAEKQLLVIGRALAGLPLAGQRRGSPVRAELENLKKVKRRALLTALLMDGKPSTDATLREAKWLGVVPAPADARALGQEIEAHKATIDEIKKKGFGYNDDAGAARAAASRWAASIEGLPSRMAAKEDDRLRKWQAKYQGSAGK